MEFLKRISGDLCLPYRLRISREKEKREKGEKGEKGALTGWGALVDFVTMVIRLCHT